MQHLNITQVSKSKSLTIELMETLRNEIVSGKFKLGEKLPSSKYIEEKAGVSRTVVREAIAQLRAEGLVESRQGVGVFVSKTVPHKAFVIQASEFESVVEAIHILQLRMAVESETAALAALNRTDEQMQAIQQHLNTMKQSILEERDSANDDLNFHLAIANATGNPYFSRFMQYIGAGVIPGRTLITENMTKEEMSSFYAAIQEEHEQIARAIQNESPEMASAAMKAHLNASIRRHKKTRRCAKRTHNKITSPNQWYSRISLFVDDRTFVLHHFSGYTHRIINRICDS